MAEPGDAVAFICNAPFAVRMALLGRMSPKWFLRMRAVCKAWRGMLDYWAAWRHRVGPPRPLICFDRVACADQYTRLRDYCVDSLDLGSDELRSVLRFTDNEHCGYFEGLRDAPPIDDFRVDYERMESYGQAFFKPQLFVHGSLDGHLLVSSIDGWYVANPLTRQWVALPNLLGCQVVGFYYYEDEDEHVVPCGGEYRLLCFYAQESSGAAGVYGVLKVTTVQLREIGCPISPAAPVDHGLEMGVDASYLVPSIQLYKGNRNLHWPPQMRQGYQMLVFDTVREEFSWKSPPPVRGQDMRLLEFPDGHLGLSISGLNKATLELWCLQDYQNEVWVLKHRIQLVIQQMPVLQDGGQWLAGVVSEEGDVLIEPLQRVLHCDRNGNLLRQFCFPQRLFAVRHMFRESLLLHPMYREPKIQGATKPTFFHGLCSE